MLPKKSRISTVRRLRIFLSAVLTVLFCGGPIISAALIDNIHGNMNLSAVQSETDGRANETLRQEYSLNWSRTLTDYLSVRANFRYYKFNLEQSQTGQFWREELQPFGEMTLNHPLLSLTSSFNRRDTRAATSGAGSIINDNWGASLKTKSINYPLVTLRYNESHIYSKNNFSTRDTRDRILQASAVHSFGRNDFRYSMTHRATQNVISFLESDITRHLAQWNFATTLNDKKVRLSSNYTFGYQTQTDQAPSSKVILRVIPISTGLYEYNGDPEYGALSDLAGLTDGVTNTAVQPEINIGETSINQNIGGDFSYARPVSRLYIYTDKTSSPDVVWSVYISDNNLNWTLYRADSTLFNLNLSLNRYEIYFPTTTTRYIKVVNTGYNEIPDVRISEIIALYLRPELENESTRSNQTHLANVNVSYRLNPKLLVLADLSGQRDFSEGIDVYNENIYYNLTFDYRPSNVLSHNLRWQQGYQSFDSFAPNYNNSSIMYGIKLKPGGNVEFSGAAYNYRSFIGDDKESDNKSLKINGRGLLFPGLNFSTEIGYGRNHLPLQGQKSDSWNFRLSFDGDVTRRISTVISMNHRISKLNGETARRIRDQLGAGINFRVSRTIRIYSSFDYISDRDIYRLQEYRLNWTVTQSLSVGGMARLIRSDASGPSERYNLRLNLRISSRTYTYFSWFLNDFSRAGGVRSDSIQAGMRTGF